MGVLFVGGKKEDCIYMRIYNDLRARITGGELRQGEKLATELELREQYAVSRDTVRKALARLEAEGFISRKPSAGTFVTVKKANYAPMPFHESFTEQMHVLGKTPSSDILSIEILSETERAIAAALELERGEKLYRICRLRRADGEPMAYEVVYLRQKFCPNIHTRIYDNTSLYELYETDYHLHMGIIEMNIEAKNGDARINKILGLKNPAALLTITSVMHLEDGTPLYYVISYHIGEKYVFKTVLPRKAGSRS
ncbi:MAG: GntR family transcriptional regulator [Oscillibacter sp.]|jgi:GntR family transcriptional regulator|nr:GntR family transcriptional regulator [Oscillibacter sp.]